MLWFIDLLNIILFIDDSEERMRNIEIFIQKFRETGQCITHNLDY